jgi:hypothetical protein
MDNRRCRDLGFWDWRPREGNDSPQTAQQVPAHPTLLPPCSLEPLSPASCSPLFFIRKTLEPIKGAEKIMNEPEKHEINIRRKSTAAIK